MVACRDATASTAGILRPDELARHVRLDRSPAGDEVGRWVENHWTLEWNLPGDRTYLSQVLPHPTTTLTLELGHRRAGLPTDANLVVTGVISTRFDVEVRGRGQVLGVRFRPGGLTALTGIAAAEWTDRTVPAAGIFPASMCVRLSDETLACDHDVWGTAAEECLLDIASDAPPDLRYEDLVGIVADMLTDRSLLTVSDVAERHHLSVRTLQRLFSHYIGITPKWVLARYRMHDVVRALDGGYDGSLTDLAVEHGWYDHAHFTRDFTALIGVPPSSYRQQPSEYSGPRAHLPAAAQAK